MSNIELNIYQQLLTQNDIYFVAFERDGQIIATNYPVQTLQLRELDDLVFLLGPTFLKQIKDAVVSNAFLPPFSITHLNFALNQLGNDPVWCLQITQTAETQEASPHHLDQDYQSINELENALQLFNQAVANGINDDLQTQIREQHLPQVEEALSKLQDPVLKSCLEIVKSSMNNLMSEHSGINSQLLELLTPSELQVAEFIRSGMSSQEIANALNVARKTVENHRNNLRSKLGITNRGVNLRSYLMSLEK
ncbi:response regulator transcription factor [Vibrio sonorensis]|uniref:response regulator transcription factor n=1 Tax=Vibrio sonorensis TaxID=1004316 RepID=UPI0008D993F5|nr:LuxR family transcriptional regulator [Vibrio sonorensis]